MMTLYDRCCIEIPDFLGVDSNFLIHDNTISYLPADARSALRLGGRTSGIICAHSGIHHLTGSGGLRRRRESQEAQTNRGPGPLQIGYLEIAVSKEITTEGKSEWDLTGSEQRSMCTRMRNAVGKAEGL